jgi:putative transposase
VAPELEKLAVKLIQDNRTWGSNRIVGALANLGYPLSDVTIENIRRRNGLDPAQSGARTQVGFTMTSSTNSQAF